MSVSPIRRHLTPMHTLQLLRNVCNGIIYWIKDAQPDKNRNLLQKLPKLPNSGIPSVPIVNVSWRSLRPEVTTAGEFGNYHCRNTGSALHWPVAYGAGLLGNSAISLSWRQEMHFLPTWTTNVRSHSDRYFLPFTRLLKQISKVIVPWNQLYGCLFVVRN